MKNLSRNSVLGTQTKLDDAEQKKTVAEGIAENVSREKAVVEVETAKAQVQAEQVAKTQSEVSKLSVLRHTALAGPHLFHLCASSRLGSRKRITDSTRRTQVRVSEIVR